jgi:serine/threonine protein kinase
MEGSKQSSSSGKSYETYKKLSTLGQGSFGTAYLVECQSSKELAVIKQIDI